MYRIDHVPWFLRPFYLALFWSLALLFFSLFWITKRLTRITIEGKVPTQAIFVLWHEDWIPYFCTFQDLRRHAWMSHPARNMLHINLYLGLCGLKRIYLGSTGNDGKEAADALVGDLRAGFSTVIAPDGPRGPAHVLKKGAFHMASQTGVPIVALRFHCSRVFRLRLTWDGKRLPLPFSRIRVRVSDPIPVVGTDFARAASIVEEALSAPFKN